MYKNILIISDNIYLCKEFEKIVAENNFQNINWSFSISPFSNFKTFSTVLKNKVSQIDLRIEKEVQIICENYNLVISLHCKQIFPPNLVGKLKCINVHPGYNPINRGWFPQVFSIINDTKIGATIHEIDNNLDHGDIIAREFVQKDSWDTSESLYEKILKTELELIRKNIKNIIENNYKIIKPENEGYLFLKEDFNNLCNIDLEKVQTIGETLNLFRALTHGDFKNAYFIDKLTNKKIFISIKLNNE